MNDPNKVMKSRYSDTLQGLVSAVGKAKGRYNSQIAMCRLREYVGLKPYWPDNYKEK